MAGQQIKFLNAENSLKSWRRRAGSNRRIKVLQTELNMSNSNRVSYCMAKISHFSIAQDFVFMRIFCSQGDKRVTRKNAVKSWVSLILFCFIAF